MTLTQETNLRNKAVLPVLLVAEEKDATSYIPSIAFSIDEVIADTADRCEGGIYDAPACKLVDLDDMACDIAGGRYSATFIGSRADLRAPGGPIETNASYMTRAWFQQQGLSEANIYPKAGNLDLHSIFGLNDVDFFLTADPDAYLTAKHTIDVESFLLTTPANVKFPAKHRVNSVREFLTRVLQNRDTN